MINIKEVRKQLDLTQEEFAREMNVTTLTIRRWEKEQRRPHLVHRLRLKSLAIKVGLKEEEK